MCFLCHSERSEEPALSLAEGISTGVPTTGASNVRRFFSKVLPGLEQSAATTGSPKPPV
jgi:hypothetical protein